MLKLFQMLTVVVACLFTFTGCASTSSEATPVAAGEKSECACAKGKSGEAVWCDHCGVGYAEGNKVKCQGCWKQKADGTPCTGCAKPAAPAEAPAPAAEAAPAADATPAPEAKAEEAATETKPN